jgi:Tfp pilus assembly protein PilF
MRSPPGLKTDDPDLPFNAALAYQNAGEAALSETQWRAALKLKQNDTDILTSLGSTLADQKKYPDAIKVLHEAVIADPRTARPIASSARSTPRRATTRRAPRS